jgi:hypothetical protein
MLPAGPQAMRMGAEESEARLVMLHKEGGLFRIIVQNIHEKVSDRFDTRGVEILTPASVGKEFLSGDVPPSPSSVRSLVQAGKLQLPQHRRRQVPARRVVLSEPEQLRRPGEDHRLPASVEPVQVTRVGHALQDGSGGGGHAATYHDLTYYTKKYVQLPQVKGAPSGDLGPQFQSRLRTAPHY